MSAIMNGDNAPRRGERSIPGGLAAQKTLFNSRLNQFQQPRILQIGAGFVIGKVAALQRSGRMNCAALA